MDVFSERLNDFVDCYSQYLGKYDLWINAGYLF